jgi:hypothetical protein
MTCHDAAPFVSAIYDGDAVPAEAVRHIAACDTCRAFLREIGGAGAELKLTAAIEALDWRAADESARELTPPAISAATAPIARRLWSSAARGVFVPRLLVGAAAVALVVGTIGWLRPHAAPTSATWFTYRVAVQCPGQAAPIDVASGSTMVGSRSQSATSESCPGDARGFASEMTVKSATSTQATITLRLLRPAEHVTPQAAMRDVAKQPGADYVYTSGETLRVPFDGAEIDITGRVETREDTSPTHASLAALLPGPDELQINAPALIRDNKDLVAVFNAGTAARPGSAIKMYAPGEGLFVFALTAPPDAAPGSWSTALAGGSELLFTDAGHKYTIYAALPLTSGDQPRTIYFRHLPSDKPSQHGQDISADSLTMIGTGSLSEFGGGGSGRKPFR